MASDASRVQFDNATNGFIANDVQAAIEESHDKSGFIAASGFTGSPNKKATVVFAQAYPDSNYNPIVTGSEPRSWSIENRAASGFVINTNANQAVNSVTFWQTSKTWS